MAYILLLLIILASPAVAVVRTVCASGCDYTSLQTAANAAIGGDILLLNAGETYNTSIGLTLPRHTGSGYVIIRSNRLHDIPGDTRALPANATSMAKITVSAGAPAIRTLPFSYTLAPGMTRNSSATPNGAELNSISVTGTTATASVDSSGFSGHAGLVITVSGCTVDPDLCGDFSLTSATSTQFSWTVSGVSPGTYTDAGLRILATSSYWRLEGLEVVPSTTGLISSTRWNAIQIGETDSEIHEDALTHHFIVDRCYIHGLPYDPGFFTGVLHNGNDVQVINSYIAEIKGQDLNGDAAGVVGWQYTKNILVRNTRLQGAAETTITGGARPHFQGGTPVNMAYLGNLYEKEPTHITFNYDADPEGSAAPGTCEEGQTFKDTDDEKFYVCNNANVFREVNRPTGEPVCVTGQKWRNLTADTVWDCVVGDWASGGTDIFYSFSAKSSTSITKGNPTVINFATNFVCGNWFQVPSCSGSTLGVIANITGGTGDWTAINGHRRYTRVDDNSISIPVNSTSFADFAGTISVTPQFIWFGQKNTFELKTGIGVLAEGNIFGATWPVTYGSQAGASVLINWLPQQDAPTSTVQDITIRNNKTLNSVTGYVSGSIQWADDSVTASDIAIGNPTVITIGGLASLSVLLTGEEICFDGGTGDFAAMNACFPATRTGASTFSIPFNSTGLDDTGQTIRMTDRSYKLRNRWPRDHRLINNLWVIGSPQNFTKSEPFISLSDSGSSLTSQVLGRSIQWQRSGEIIHNTFIKRGMGPTAQLQTDFSIDPAAIGIQNSSSTPKAWDTLRITARDNVFDGSGGRFFGSSGTTPAGCDTGIDAVWGNAFTENSKVKFARNVSNHASVWGAGITATEYNGTCSGFGSWVWARSGASLPATLTSVVISDDDTACPDTPTAQQKMVITWGAAARLLPNSWFRLQNYTTPSGDVNGLWQIPATPPPGTSTITESSTAWALCVPNFTAATYTGGTITSTMDWTDYDAGDYSFASTSPFKNYATDGADPGIIKPVLDAATEMASSGLYNPYLDVRAEIVPSDTTATVSFIDYNTTHSQPTICTNLGCTTIVGSATAPACNGRSCTSTLSGLTAGIPYTLRLNLAGSRPYYKDFITRRYAIEEPAYYANLKTGIESLKAAATGVGSAVPLGCHLVFAQANGFVADAPATYENLTVWQNYADNLAAAGCTRIAINIDLTPWIANDATDITRYTDIFTYIKTTLGLQLELDPQASGLAKTAIQALPACPNGGAPCYDGTFDSPGDWFSGAKGAMAALAQLPSTARPHQITVVHEPTTANSQLGISGSNSQWNSQITNFITDATYGIGVIDTTIVTAAGCHVGESAYCQLFSDNVNVDRIGIDFYTYANISAALAMVANALDADGTPKDVYIEELSHTAWTNTGAQSEQLAIHGYGYARSYSPVCYACQFIDGAARMFTAAGVTGINIFWTQPFRYLAAEGEPDNGLNVTYNGNVAGTDDQTLTVFGQFVKNYSLFN